MSKIAQFAGTDARLYALAEVARLVEKTTGKKLNDPAAWLRRRGVPTVTRMYRGRRLTLVHPADFYAAKKPLPKVTRKVDNVAPMRQTKASTKVRATPIRRKAA